MQSVFVDCRAAKIKIVPGEYKSYVMNWKLIVLNHIGVRVFMYDHIDQVNCNLSTL